MSEAPSFTFFTNSPDVEPLEARWHDDGIGDAFFASAKKARAAIVELREVVAQEPDQVVPSMRLERIETVPVTQETMLALLNEGVGAIVETYDIVETIEGGAHGESA